MSLPGGDRLVTLIRMRIRYCIPTSLVAVLVAASMAPAARASDPLLSGYSGPGGGEQAVLGSTLIPPKHGNGSLSKGKPAAPAPAAGASTTSATPPPAPAPAATGPATPATPAKPGNAGRGSRPSGARRETPERPAVAKPSPDAARTPVAVASPQALAASRSSPGPLPLTRQQVLLGLIGGALLMGAAAATAAVAGGRERHA